MFEQRSGVGVREAAMELRPLRLGLVPVLRFFLLATQGAAECKHLLLTFVIVFLVVPEHVCRGKRVARIGGNAAQCWLALRQAVASMPAYCLVSNQRTGCFFAA